MHVLCLKSRGKVYSSSSIGFLSVVLCPVHHLNSYHDQSEYQNVKTSLERRRP